MTRGQMRPGRRATALLQTTLLPGGADARWWAPPGARSDDERGGAQTRRHSDQPFEQTLAGPLRLAQRLHGGGDQVRLMSRDGPVQGELELASGPGEGQPPVAAEAAQTEQKRRLRRRRRDGKVRVPMEASMEEEGPEVSRERKKRILMLISDTGGGHRASAQAMEAMLDQVAPGATDVRIVDVWTDYTPWPFSHFVKGYSAMAKNPWIWRLSWYSSCHFPNKHFLETFADLRCTKAITRCINDHDPDLVVSVHPLTQSIPLKILEKKGGGTRKVPFATVVTDLGSAHPWWFHSKVDACFIPSDEIKKVAKRSGLKGDQIRQYGLPVRPSFWQTPRPRDKLLAELGLEGDRKTVLVVGGGDGVGSLGKIVESTASELAKSCPGTAQVVAVCGKNAQLRGKLESQDFGNVNVQVRAPVASHR